MFLYDYLDKKSVEELKEAALKKCVVLHNKIVA